MVTASIVLFNTDPLELTKVVQSILNTSQNLLLFLIDNSPKDDLKVFQNSNLQVKYIHNPSNPGFGAAHNLAIKEAIQLNSICHFIVNPDVYFEGDVITNMVDFFKKDPTIGMMMPQILNTDGTVQNLPKLLPTPLSVVLRKIKWPKSFYQKFIDNYELRNISQELIYNAPILSGCFTLLNLDAVKKVGMYDDRFFMYFEDWDLSRRIHQQYKTIYFPKTSVYHGYESGANKSRKLFLIFMKSAIAYFNKWGWFIDKERIKMNKQTLTQFN